MWWRGLRTGAEAARSPSRGRDQPGCYGQVGSGGEGQGPGLRAHLRGLGWETFLGPCPAVAAPAGCRLVL